MADVEAPVPQVVLNRSKSRRQLLIIGGAVLVVVIVLAITGWYFWSKSTNPVLTPLTPGNSIVPIASIPPISLQDGSTYYYTWIANPSNPTTNPTTAIYKLKSDLHTPDQKVQEFSSQYNIFGSYINSDEFLGNQQDNKIQIINVSTQQVSDLIVGPPGQYIESAKLSPDKKWLAYTILDRSGQPVSATMSVWLYNLTTQQTQQILQEPVTAAQVPIIAGWKGDSSQIVLQNLASDMGGVTGELSVIDAQSPYTKRVISVPPTVQEAFLRGRLSPDGQWWLYNYCTQTQLDTNSNLTGCPAGEDVFISNIATGQFRSIFKNTIPPDTDETGLTGLVFDSSWQDADHVVVTTPTGIYQLGLNNEPAQQLYQFGWSPDQAVRENPLITAIRGSYLVFQYSTDFGKKVLDLTTQKVMELNPEGSIQGFL